MRLDLPRLKEQLGSVSVYGLQSVHELDAGWMIDERMPTTPHPTQRIDPKALRAALREMAIVVPVMGEKLRLVQGVLSGIPHPCQIIIVSNSAPERFLVEKDMADNFAATANRSVICVHQKDSKIARAFEKAGYADILGDDRLVRSGKAEGMIIGAMLAQLTGRSSVGYVDSDNYFPGAVLEYCYLFATGFAQARRKDGTMVRISWNSKPKVNDNSLYFAKWGRSSIVTNAQMNKLLSSYSGFESESVKTGNAGEHAMSIDLALSMGWSSGYSIEPYQLIWMFEQYGGVLDNSKRKQKPLTIYQLESRNPHMHESKGDEHVEKMIESSVSVIYHSPLCTDKQKAAIENDLAARGIRPKGEPIPVMKQYPPLNTADFTVLREMLTSVIYGSEPTMVGPRLA